MYNGTKRLLAALICAVMAFTTVGFPAYADETDTPAPETIIETVSEPAGETPAEPADETPAEPADETPAEPADETPAETPDETPAERADETPDEVTDETPDEPAGEATEEAAEDETTDETPDEPVPFRQETTVDGVKFTVMADAGVFANGATLSISKTGSGELTQAAEAVLGIAANETTIIRHAVYSVSGAEMNGSVRLVLDQLGFSALQQQYPDGALSVYVLRHAPQEQRAEDRAKRVSADINLEQNKLSFSLSELGLFDVVTVIRLPEPTEEQTEEPAEGETEEPAEQPAEDETEEPAEQPAEGETEEPAEQPTEGETEEPAEQPAESETEEPTEEPTESETEEPAEQSAEGEPEEPAEAETEEPTEEPTEDPAEELTEEPAEEPEEVHAPFEATGESSSGTVTVSAEPGVFPADAKLIVSDPAPTRRLMKAAAPKAVQTEIVVASYAYEITMTDAEDNPIQPAEGTTATVTFQLMEAGDPNLSVRVLHETADGAEQLPAYAVDGAVVAQTTGFSKYTVEFYYNQKEYVLAGDSSVALSEILSAVGLTGEVTAVEVSDASLFSASDETGEWIVAAHQAFSTTEWMKVTINGVVYEIIVTDDSMVSVTYVRQEWNGAEVVSASVTENIPVVPADGSMTSGKYFLNSNVTVNSRVSLTGNTELILGDGYTLDVKGLYIPAGSTLTIYGQSAGTGKLYSHPSGGAAIGGYSEHDNGNIVIHGGTIEAYGYDNCAGIGSNDGKTGGSITIYGGTIRAKGGSDGAAIGGGRNCSGGNITIYGGDITANDPSDSDPCENGAGIGGGDRGEGGTIVIRGGTITTYSRDGAGIGGGDDGDGGTITIHGGTITSTKVNQGQGARIGGGCDGAPGTITIHGGTITTVGGSGAGIGGGKGNKSGGTVTIDGGVISASGSYGIGSGENGSDVAVTLGYTDGTRDGISITASSYNGTVTLGQPFAKFTGNAEQYLAGTFIPGVVSDNSLLGGGALKAWSGEVFDWQTLQMAIDGAGNGATITLSQDIVADYASDAALHVASGKNITIDLNGCTINRNLTDREASVYGNQGYVILNEGTLTIADSSSAQTGTITGGNCKDAGGGIYNSGTLTITGGSITGNAATTWGGGIYLPNDTGAVLHLNGGAITNNTCGNNGGGVHVSGSAAMTVSGSPVVSGNTKNGAANNVNLASGAVMQVTGALTEGANLCVSASGGTAVITSGYGAKNGTTYPGAYFTADNANYGIALADGEVKIATPFTVTIPADDQARLSVDKPSAQQGDTITVTVLDDDTALNMISVYYMEGSSTKHVNFTPGTGKTGTFTMPATDVTVRVNPPVSYWANNKSNTYSGNYTVVTSDTTTWTDGWYVVNENVTINQRIEVTGVVTLVVMGKNDNDRCALDANAGIHVPDPNSLIIYGETANNGLLRACSNGYALPDKCAAIGGNNRETNGPIIINSGFVGASSKGTGAAIGGGDQGSGVSITINGGNVMAVNACASEDKGGAGIGGGTGESGVTFSGGGLGDGKNITINGGVVTGWSMNGAGIGGGCAGCGYRITINGGTVNARSYCGAGIGGGQYAAGFAIKIYGGTVNAVSLSGGAGIGNGEGSEEMFPSGASVIANTIGGDIGIRVFGGDVTASSSYLEGSSQSNSAFVYSDSPTPHIPLGIYTGAKITGGYSKDPTTLVDESDILDKYLNYVTIHPCTHENATYEVISAETHKEQCTDCRTAFPEEPHTLGADGVCAVCGYDSHSSYVSFDSAGGSNVEAQRIPNGEKATRPDNPTWEGHTFQNWYRVTDAATGAHEAQPFDFENTAITESVTLIAVWNHEHDGITFQSWTSDSSLPTSAGSYFLTKDVTLTSVWAWNSGTMNLCLAGHTVTGNINNSSDALITVNGGTLNLFDEEDGTVTLVNARAATVAVETGGTFHLYGGTITSPTNDSLQGVDVAGTFHMSGGRITGNPTGVRVKSGGAFTVSGSARVTGNTVNVDLTLGNGKIQIGGALSDDARIGVTAYAGVVTSGLNGNGGLENFFSDDPYYAVFLSSDGEVRLGTPVTVTFDSNGGSAVDSQTVNAGEKATKPEDPTKEGCTFKGWQLNGEDYDFDTAVTEDIELKAVWEELPTVIIKSANVEFQGLIRLQFTFTFPAEVLTDEGSYLTFEKAGTTTTRLVSEGSASGEDVCFMISVPAPEYADDITIKVYDSEGRQLTLKSSKGTDYTENGFVYSVKAYAQKMSVDGSTEQMRRLAKALDDYGTAAQIYFTYGDYYSLSVDGAVTAVTLEDLAPYALTTSGTRPAGVTGAGIMVEFESDNTLRITFKTDGSKPLSDYTFLLDGVEATPTKSGKNAYLQVVNIAAPNLDTAHSFTVSDGTDTYTITASALSYAYTSVKNGNAARQNLGKALYLYNQAANTRFGN